MFYLIYLNLRSVVEGINGVVVTWVVAIDPPGVRFPLNAYLLRQKFCFCLPRNHPAPTNAVNMTAEQCELQTSTVPRKTVE